MAHRLYQQRRGRGTTTFRATKKGKKSEYITYDQQQKEDKKVGQVTRLLTDPQHYSILAEMKFDDKSKQLTIAAEGIQVGQTIEYGKTANLELGNVIPLGQIIEGCPIFNIEKTPGDGGTLVKSSGLYSLIVTKDNKAVYVKMPSGKTIAFNHDCRATIGCAAGGGRKEKPFVKAGNKYHLMKAKSRKYAKNRGVAMNVVDHPHGGLQHHVGKSKSVSRHASPGRKVGAIASKRTGRRKK